MIFSILSLATLAACGVERTYPDEPIYIANIKTGVCAEKKLIDPVAIKFQHVKDHPLSECQLLTGYKPKSFKTVQSWARDVIQELLRKMNLRSGK